MSERDQAAVILWGCIIGMIVTAAVAVLFFN